MTDIIALFFLSMALIGVSVLCYAWWKGDKDYVLYIDDEEGDL